MTISNNNAVLELGTKAAQAWDRSQSNGDAGDALAINAMYLAYHTMTFSCTVSRKGVDIDETIDFDMNAWATPLFNSDGSKDTKAMAARSAAVSKALFNIDTLTNAVKQRIDRAKRSAIYLATTIGEIENFADVVTMKGNKLVVPYGLVHKAPADDASDNDKAIYEAMKDKACTLDGKNGASLAELGKRARPETAKRAPTQTSAEQAKSFNDSVKFVTAIMLQQNADDGESDIALSNAQRLSLYELQVSLAAYFVADPITDSVDEKKAA